MLFIMALSGNTGFCRLEFGGRCSMGGHMGSRDMVAGGKSSSLML
jgi:hypothetical protein